MCRDTKNCFFDYGIEIIKYNIFIFIEIYILIIEDFEEDIKIKRILWIRNNLIKKYFQTQIMIKKGNESK